MAVWCRAMRRRRAGVHRQVGLVVDLDRPCLHHPLVDKEIIGQPLGVGHPDAPAVAADGAGVAHLAAGFAIEGGGGRDHLHLFAGLRLLMVALHG